MTFSILSRIEPSATVAHFHILLWFPPAFSILSRIEPSATSARDQTDARLLTFQYPLSDRTLCNRDAREKPVIKPRLSVSSLGSNPLQRGVGSGAMRPARSFSILSRIEPSATLSCTFISLLFDFLSVSSLGSNPLQLTLMMQIITGDWDFQYPLSDRTLCNRAECEFEHSPRNAFSILSRIEPSATCRHKNVTLENIILSVSSLGSNSLQLRQPLVDASDHLSFSILERIELSATQPVPQRHHRCRLFQYPRTDRTLCNRHRQARGANRESAFSILERIELSATQP